MYHRKIFITFYENNIKEKFLTVLLQIDTKIYLLQIDLHLQKIDVIYLLHRRNYNINLIYIKNRTKQYLF